MYEQLIPRRKFRIHAEEFGDTWQVVSYKKKASDVELEGGETVQHRIDHLKALLIELTEAVTNLKANEGQNHTDIENLFDEIDRLLSQGLSDLDNEALGNIPVEGEGASSFVNWRDTTLQLINDIRTRLERLRVDIDALLDYEPDDSGGSATINVYDYLTNLLNILENDIIIIYNSLVDTVGDCYVMDVFNNAGIEVDDNTDTSLVGALKVQHERIKNATNMLEGLDLSNPPFAWERYEYDQSDDPSTCPVKVTPYVPGSSTVPSVTWRVVFFYQPVFKLIKLSGYFTLQGNGTITDTTYVDVDITLSKLRLFYVPINGYERMEWIAPDVSGLSTISTYCYIDPKSGLLTTSDSNTSTLRVFFNGNTLPVTYQFQYLGISRGGETDAPYLPKDFGVWDSQIPDKPGGGFDASRIIHNAATASYTSYVIYVDSDDFAYIPMPKTLVLPWAWNYYNQYLSTLPNNAIYEDYMLLPKNVDGRLKNVTTGNVVYYAGDSGFIGPISDFYQMAGIDIPDNYVIVKAFYISGLSLDDTVIFERMV